MPDYDDPKKLYLREKLDCRAKVGSKVFTFDVRIQDIDAKGILATPPDLGGPVLNPGQEVLVRYYRQDSAYQFLTKVLAYEERPPASLMRIGFPTRITRFQRRKQTRAEIGGTVRFLPTGQINNPIRGYVKDISAGGVKLSTRQVGMFNTALPPVGQGLTLDFTLPGGHEFIGIQGVIRRTSNDGDRPGHVVVQVEFTKIKPTVAERIELLSRRYK